MGQHTPFPPKQVIRFLRKNYTEPRFEQTQKNNAVKRGAGQTEVVLSELEDCIPSPESAEQDIDDLTIVQSINEFLAALPKIDRPSKLDPYNPLLHELMADGIYNCVVQLERLQETGYDGGIRYTQGLRASVQASEEAARRASV